MNKYTIMNKHAANLENRYGFKTFAFLLGLLITNNIVYIFKVGGVILNISLLYSFIVVIYLMIFRGSEFKKSLEIFNKPFLYYIVVALFSSISAVVVFFNHIELISRYFNGIIYLFLQLFPYILTLVVHKEKMYLIKGISFGYFINLIMSLFSFLNFRVGNVFTLYNIFPQNYFFIPSYTFRPQGLFLEPSYYLAFLMSTFLILFTVNRMGIFKVSGILMTIFIIAISLSGNVPLFVLLIFLYLLINARYKDNRRHRLKFSTLLTTILICFIILIFMMANWELVRELNIVGKFLAGWSDFNNTFSKDATNTRVNNMIIALSILPRYPLGVGFNMSHSILEVLYLNTLTVNSTFNFLITNQLELGIFGTIIYMYMIKQLSFDIIIKGRNKYSIALGLSVFGAFLCQVGNGIKFYPFILVIFGLATVERSNILRNYNNS